MSDLKPHPLAAWRKSQNLSQKAAGKLLFDVDRWTINSIETGRRKPSPELAIRISEVTGLSRHDLRPDLWDAPEAAA